MRRREFPRLSRPARITLSGLLPGALAGIHVTGLLLFLNPGIPLSWRAVAAGSLRFGLALSALSIALHWAVPALRRGSESFRALPWTLTAVFAAAAAGAGVNASRFAYFLPPGVNDRLIKAALWLSLAAIVGFYTALLHSLHHRPHGARSRILFLAIAGASVLAVLERREAFRPPVFNPPKIADLSPSRRLQVMVVALPGASLDLILPLAEQGNLPFLASVLHGGSAGRLAGISPERHPALWATLATGKLPFRHGVFDRSLWEAGFLGEGVEVRLLPAGAEIPMLAFGLGAGRPVDSRTLRALPLWGALGRVGLEVATIDMPLTAPPDHDTRWVLPDRFFLGGQASADEPLAALARRFEVSRVDLPAEIRAAVGAPALVESLAADLWRRDVALRLLADRPELDVILLRLPGLEVAGRAAFGGFSATQFEGARGRKVKAAAAMLVAYAAQVDRILAGLWDGARRSDRLLLVVSPYGLSAPSRWQQLWGDLSRRPAVEGQTGQAEDGCLLVMGSGIRAGVELRGARALDLAPTLYYALGLPIPRDLDGRTLTELFDPAFLATHPLTFVPSYETLPSSGR